MANCRACYNIGQGYLTCRCNIRDIEVINYYKSIGIVFGFPLRSAPLVSTFTYSHINWKHSLFTICSEIGPKHNLGAFPSYLIIIEDVQKSLLSNNELNMTTFRKNDIFF